MAFLFAVNLHPAPWAEEMRVYLSDIGSPAGLHLLLFCRGSGSVDGEFIESHCVMGP